MNQTNSSNASARRVARQIVDMREEKRKAVLKSLSSEMKCRVVEEMVSIRLERMRGPNGVITSVTASER